MHVYIGKFMTGLSYFVRQDDKSSKF